MRRQRRGAALVELAIVMPLLLLLLLGIIEFGMIMHAQVMLDQGAREGARTAAIGGLQAEIVAETVRASVPALRPDQVHAEFRSPSTGLWEPIGDTADQKENAVPRGVKVRVTIQGYRHRLVTGSFFAWLPGYKDGGFPMAAAMTMRRE
jgi:Flp pilus assembly protein TadG